MNEATATTDCAGERALAHLAALAAHDAGGRGFSDAAAGDAGPLRAAAAELAGGERVVIVTGFCIRAAMIGENDGPPGALALADALRRLGKEVAFVSDRFSSDLIAAGAHIYGASFPITVLDPQQARADAQIATLLETFRPTQVVAIERPGSAADGHRYSMRGLPLDDLVPAADTLLVPRTPRNFRTIAIGDGGNELGLGTLRASHMHRVAHGERIFCTTPADIVIPAGISNWGAHALVGALSVLCGTLLMHPPERERQVLEALRAAGAVDGCTGSPSLSVDGIDWPQYAQILHDMFATLRAGAIPPA